MTTAASGNALSTTTTAMVAGPVVGSTVYVNPNTRVTESQIAEIARDVVVKALREMPIEKFENIVAWRRRGEGT